MLTKAKQAGDFGATSDSRTQAKQEINDWLYHKVEGAVQSGPFEGMLMLPDTAWREAHIAPMLLGCYEEELHGVLQQQIDRLKRHLSPNIVVVGAGEGYYAIGLKRRLPSAKVYAIEASDESKAIAKRNAELNGVEVTCDADLGEVFFAPDFIVMDCEGAEVAYLDYAKFPALARAHILVEIHNLLGQDTATILLDRFRGTHRIDMLFEGPRNPNKHEHLVGMTSDYRWLAVSEGRPCLMSWYSMTPRGTDVK